MLEPLLAVVEAFEGRRPDLAAAAREACRAWGSLGRALWRGAASQTPRSSLKAMAHMTSPMTASRLRHAEGLAKTGLSQAAP